MALFPISAIGPASAMPVAPPAPMRGTAQALGGATFAELLNAGLDGVDAKVARADALMKAFALGDPVPVHQVTIALEEARIAVELAVQVRERLTETYRSFMNMQI
ncbi:MAG: flagellar hook-basal body complex protein FliE [Novosphingobium sp.]|uniref:flagellar hook-basal body complex protein FliE n=1 Tax=Novosphingobium sp. TaxID=1874826 RepID=UPI0032B875FF